MDQSETIKTNWDFILFLKKHNFGNWMRLNVLIHSQTAYCANRTGTMLNAASYYYFNSCYRAIGSSGTMAGSVQTCKTGTPGTPFVNGRWDLKKIGKKYNIVMNYTTRRLAIMSRAGSVTAGQGVYNASVSSPVFPGGQHGCSLWQAAFFFGLVRNSSADAGITGDITAFVYSQDGDGKTNFIVYFNKQKTTFCVFSIILF
jgi:hypothetical protein